MTDQDEGGGLAVVAVTTAVAGGCGKIAPTREAEAGWMRLDDDAAADRGNPSRSTCSRMSSASATGTLVGTGTTLSVPRGSFIPGRRARAVPLEPPRLTEPGGGNGVEGRRDVPISEASRASAGLAHDGNHHIVPTAGPSHLRYLLPALTQVARASRNPFISTSREWSSANTGARAK